MRYRVALAVLVLCAVSAVGAVAPAFAGSEDDAALIALEKSLWAAWMAHDGAPFEQHLADGVTHTNSGGRSSGKAAVVAMMASDVCKVSGYELGDVTVHHFGDHTALLTYEASQDAVCEGEAIPARVLSTSVWVKVDGSWRNASYQETVVATAAQ
jgi:uncharacterized protein (TIGR02246 family)